MNVQCCTAPASALALRHSLERRRAFKVEAPKHKMTVNISGTLTVLFATGHAHYLFSDARLIFYIRSASASLFTGNPG